MKLKPSDAAEIDRRFDLHRPADEDAGKRCDQVRAAIKTAAQVVAAATPAGREQAAALTHLEQALFFGVGAVVRPAPPASRPRS